MKIERNIIGEISIRILASACKNVEAAMLTSASKCRRFSRSV
jgi:hypothetical protein